MKKFNPCEGIYKSQMKTYGTRFAKDGDAEYFISKCEERIEKYKMWLRNFELLQSEIRTEMLKAREGEIRQFLSSCTPEEIAAFQTGNGN